MHRRVRTYSHGMRQRLAIAQAMLGSARLLVLDEPTNGLDPPQIREMREVLGRYAATGRTVLISSHLLAEVEQTSSHVVVMHQGRLVAQGPVAELVGSATSPGRGRRPSRAGRRGGRVPRRRPRGGDHAERDHPSSSSGRRAASSVKAPRRGRPGRRPDHAAARARKGLPGARGGGLNNANARHAPRDRSSSSAAKQRAGPGRGRPRLLGRPDPAAERGDRPAVGRVAGPGSRWGFLVVLPFLLVAAFQLGRGSNRRGAPGFVDLATTGAANFTMFTLFAATGFLLVVVFALFAGDTVASEASWSSLRYLLASPVPRGRLLRQKLLVALGFLARRAGAAARRRLPRRRAVLRLEPEPGAAGHDLRHRRGPDPSRAGRLAYIAVTLLFVSALAFLIGVWTDAPLGAVGGAVLLVIVSNILDAVTALGDWRQVLPTHYQYAWTDLLGPTIVWDQVARGALWSLAYSLVLFAAAWWHFLRKDIVS